jgi:hypothetical protein
MPDGDQPPFDGGQPAFDPTIYQPAGAGSSTPAGASERTELLSREDVQEVNAWLIVMSEGPRFGDMIRISGPSFMIGRAGDCDLVLEDGAASRQHAKIRLEDNGQKYVLHDMATDNGTFVNDNTQTPVELKNGDTIRIGRTELNFKQIV